MIFRSKIFFITPKRFVTPRSLYAPVNTHCESIRAVKNFTRQLVRFLALFSTGRSVVFFEFKKKFQPTMVSSPAVRAQSRACPKRRQSALLDSACSPRGASRADLQSSRGRARPTSSSGSAGASSTRNSYRFFFIVILASRK